MPLSSSITLPTMVGCLVLAVLDAVFQRLERLRDHFWALLERHCDPVPYRRNRGRESGVELGGLDYGLGRVTRSDESSRDMEAPPVET